MGIETVSRTPDVETVREQLRVHTEQIKQRELDEALSKLEARGELSAAQREVVTQLADEITDQIVAAPAATLEESFERDERVARTVIRLFELNANDR